MKDFLSAIKDNAFFGSIKRFFGAADKMSPDGYGFDDESIHPLRPRMQLLCNGSYLCAVTDSGTGFSLYRGREMIPKSSNILIDPPGIYADVLCGGSHISLTYAPDYNSKEKRSAVFGGNYALYSADGDCIKAKMLVTLDGAAAAERRGVKIINRSLSMHDVAVRFLINGLSGKLCEIYDGKTASFKAGEGFIAVSFDDRGEFSFADNGCGAVIQRAFDLPPRGKINVSLIVAAGLTRGEALENLEKSVEASSDFINAPSLVSDICSKSCVLQEAASNVIYPLYLSPKQLAARKSIPESITKEQRSFIKNLENPVFVMIHNTADIQRAVPYLQLYAAMLSGGVRFSLIFGCADTATFAALTAAADAESAWQDGRGPYILSPADLTDDLLNILYAVCVYAAPSAVTPMKLPPRRFIPFDTLPVGEYQSECFDFSGGALRLISGKGRKAVSIAAVHNEFVCFENVMLIMRLGGSYFDLLKGAQIKSVCGSLLCRGEAGTLATVASVSLCEQTNEITAEVILMNNGNVRTDGELAFYCRPFTGRGTGARLARGQSHGAFVFDVINGRGVRITSSRKVKSLCFDTADFFSGRWFDDGLYSADPCAAVITKIECPARDRERIVYKLTGGGRLDEGTV